MTDRKLEEKATKYAVKVCKTSENVKFFGKIIKRTYIEAVKENCKNCKTSIVWHNIKKNPEDLPNDSHTVLDENGELFYYFRGQFYYLSDSLFNHKPSAWCEVPEYTEKL